VWGGQEGSLLTLALLQAGVSALAARGRPRSLWPLVLAILERCALFLAATLFLSNPFAQSLPCRPTAPASIRCYAILPWRCIRRAVPGVLALAVPLAWRGGIVTGEKPVGGRRPGVYPGAWFFLGQGLLLGRVGPMTFGWGGYRAGTRSRTPL
jgi:hypothetical protein